MGFLGLFLTFENNRLIYFLDFAKMARGSGSRKFPYFSYFLGIGASLNFVQLT